MQNQSKDAFPSDIRKNWKDCMEVNLKGGREIERRKEKEKKLRKKKKKLEEN